MQGTRYTLAALATTAVMALFASVAQATPVVRPPLPSPMPPVVQMAADDPMADYAGYWDGQVIHVADITYKFGIRHELGHVYDEQFMDAGERQRFATLLSEYYDDKGRIAGRDDTRFDLWLTLAENPDGTVTSNYWDLSEKFADAYAACRSGYVRESNHLWETAYEYDPTASQHRRICKMIARTAATPGTPLSPDGYR